MENMYRITHRLCLVWGEVGKISRYYVTKSFDPNIPPNEKVEPRNILNLVILKERKKQRYVTDPFASVTLDGSFLSPAVLNTRAMRDVLHCNINHDKSKGSVT